MFSVHFRLILNTTHRLISRVIQFLQHCYQHRELKSRWRLALSAQADAFLRKRYCIMSFRAWHNVVLHQVEILQAVGVFSLAHSQRGVEQTFQCWRAISVKTTRINTGCQRLLWTWERRDRYTEQIFNCLQGSALSVRVLCDRWQQSSTPYAGRQTSG